MVIMQWIARESMPFSVVNSPAFRQMINFCNQRYTVKNSTTFSKNKLPLFYESVMGTVKDLIATEVPHCPLVAFTTDGWTSANSEPYMTLTLHYINKDFVMRKFVLNFDNFIGRHTGYHIGRELDNMIREHPALVNVSEKIIIHDAAANMTSALEEMSENCQGKLCGDHLLNTSLKHAVNGCSDVAEVIKVATDLATKLNRSNLANQLLVEECKKLGLDCVKVITPVCTRWNSNSFMLDSILRMKATFVSLRERTSAHCLDDVLPTNDQFLLMEALAPVLSSLRIFSEFMSTDTKPTMASILVLLNNVKTFFGKYLFRLSEKKSPKFTVIKEFCNLLEKEMFKEKRFGKIGKFHIFSNIFDIIFLFSNLVASFRSFSIKI